MPIDVERHALQFTSMVLLALLVVLGGCDAERERPVLSSDADLTRVQRTGTADVRVGTNVHVSAAHEERPHFELSLAAHPDRPGVLLGAGMVWSESASKYELVAYRSADGGRTWSPALEVSRRGTVQDPALAFGPDGWAYFAEWGSGELLLHRSPDGGSTWKPARTLYTMDRPWVSVGPSGTEHEGRIYVPGNGGEGSADLAVLRLDDHGRTTRSRTELDVTSGKRRMLAPGNSAVLSDGTLLFPYLVRIGDIGRYEADTYHPRTDRAPNAMLEVAASIDGGETFQTGRSVAPWYHRFGRGRTATIPSLAADTSDGPFQDRIYAAWTDFRSGEGEILLSHSSDRGKHWSDPIVVNRSGGPAFRPELAVNGDGVLGISWYDRRDSPTGMGWSVRFAASVDGGETVTRSVRVSEKGFRYSWERDPVLMSSAEGGRSHEASAIVHSFNTMGGHTAGLAAAADGTFHPFWVDNRTGVPQIWTAPVEVDAEAVRHGAAALADRQDVTPHTALSIGRTQYDPATQIVTLNARLRNVSDRAIQAPLSLRILDLWSEFGEARLVVGDERMQGHGTVLDLTSDVPGGTLLPDSTTASFTVRARLDSAKALGALQPPPPTREAHGGYGLLRIRTQALARIDEGEGRE